MSDVACSLLPAATAPGRADQAIVPTAPEAIPDLICFWDFQGPAGTDRVAWSMLFAVQKGREILRWIMKPAQAFPKKVHFIYCRILRGFKDLLDSLPDP